MLKSHLLSFRSRIRGMLLRRESRKKQFWIPAFAGMTNDGHFDRPFVISTEGESPAVNPGVCPGMPGRNL